MTQWFCYELDFASRWHPVIYHMEKPTAKRGEEHRLAGPWSVPDDCFGSDGQPLLGALQRRFPAPKEDR